MALTSRLFILLFATCLGCTWLLPSFAWAQSNESANELEDYVKRNALAGAVTLVANKDAIVDIDVAGYADIANQKPMAEDSIFWIASQTKPITGTALMILVDQGKVDLSAPIEKYLPDFKNSWVISKKDDKEMRLKRPARAVTVRDVMSHVSGYPYGIPIEEPSLDLINLKDRVRAYSLVPLESDPGTRFQYSNVGINIGGRIIEAVSGRPYEVFLQEELFAPLGMVDTTFFPTEAQAQRIAKTYRPDDAKSGLVEMPIKLLHSPLTDREARFAMPAGGLFSTARDLAKFLQMVLNGGELNGRRYLSKEAVSAMTTRQSPPEIQQSFGVGWQVSDGGYGHGGAYSTNMTVDSRHGLITVFLVQQAGFPLDGNKTQGVFREGAMKKFAK